MACKLSIELDAPHGAYVPGQPIAGDGQRDRLHPRKAIARPDSSWPIDQVDSVMKSGPQAAPNDW